MTTKISWVGRKPLPMGQCCTCFDHERNAGGIAERPLNHLDDLEKRLKEAQKKKTRQNKDVHVPVSAMHIIRLATIKQQ